MSVPIGSSFERFGIRYCVTWGHSVPTSMALTLRSTSSSLVVVLRTRVALLPQKPQWNCPTGLEHVTAQVTLSVLTLLLSSSQRASGRRHGLALVWLIE